MPERWQVEVAALLSQLGYITLPAETAEKIYYGWPLSADEQLLASRLPAQNEELLGNIPRLDDVRAILRTSARPYRAGAAAPGDHHARIVERGAQVLGIAVDFDALESSDRSAGRAMESLVERASHYDPDVLAALMTIRGAEHRSDVREVATIDLALGMILAEDFKLDTGVLLAARGYDITERFLARVRNFTDDGMHKATWRVIVPA